jgi:hypothetical protein
VGLGSGEAPGSFLCYGELPSERGEQPWIHSPEVTLLGTQVLGANARKSSPGGTVRGMVLGTHARGFSSGGSSPDAVLP